MNAFWLVLAVLLWGVMHSLLASLQVKALVRRAFGPMVDRVYRLVYNLISGISLLPVVWLAISLPDRTLYRLTFPWLLLALIGQVVALGLLATGLLQTGVLEFLGLRQLGFPRDTPPSLVTGGLYRHVRHPLYIAGLVFIWLSPIMTVNLLVLYALLSIYILIGAGFEERKLRREYGEVYAAYQAVTPMIIPFLKWNKTRR